MTPTDYAVLFVLISTTAMTIWNIHNRQIVNAYGVTVQDLKPLPQVRTSPTPVQYATKEEINALSNEMKEGWVSINNNSVRHATDQIEIDKKFSKVTEEIQTIHSRLNDLVKKQKPLEKTVNVHHSYTTPMQVDLIYPEKVQSKGKGRGALLKRASQ